MRKLFLTLVFGLFFVAFSNAQSATVTDAAKINEKVQEQLTKDALKSDNCDSGCTKSCCDKKRSSNKDCATKKKDSGSKKSCKH